MSNAPTLLLPCYLLPSPLPPRNNILLPTTTGLITASEWVALNALLLFNMFLPVLPMLHLLLLLPPQLRKSLLQFLLNIVAALKSHPLATLPLPCL